MNVKAALYTGLCLSVPFLIMVLAVFFPAAIGFIAIVFGVGMVVGVIGALMITAAADLYDFFNERSR